MAGAGKKTFTAGEVLTASDVNGYLMEQSVMVFGGTAARSSAIPTPSEGMVSYVADVDNLQLYNGSAWQPASGLQLVKTQTIGTGVSSVTVTGAFSAAYDAYKVIISGGVASTNNVLNMQFPSNTTAYYWSAKNVSWAGVTTDYTGNNTGSFGRVGYGTADNIQCTFELVNPFLTKNTIFTGTYIAPIAGGDGAYTTGALLNTNSISSFTINTGAGTLTGGTIAVYGYSK